MIGDEMKKCSCGNTSDLTEVYSGDDIDEDEKEFICSTCLRRELETEDVGFCRCCGEGIVYPIDDLDEKSLCPEHKGEFDRDEEEQQDWDDYIENVTKDG